jgi:N-carbamoyl-L-amino-acid hydrolase
VLFTIDFRHPDDALRKHLGDQVAVICAEEAGACEVSVTELRNEATVHFDQATIAVVRDAAAARPLPHRDIFSGAGHDAGLIAPLCPTAMVFVPCAGGVSHNETESATPEDTAAGARVLTDAITAMANGAGPATK